MQNNTPAKFAPARRSPDGRQRNAAPQSRRTVRPTPVHAVSTTATGAQLTVVFDAPVVLTGVPRWGLGSPAAYPTAAALLTPTTLRLTYLAAVENGAAPAVPFEDASVCNMFGGCVSQRVPAVVIKAASATSDEAETSPLPMKRAA